MARSSTVSSSSRVFRFTILPCFIRRKMMSLAFTPIACEKSRTVTGTSTSTLPVGGGAAAARLRVPRDRRWIPGREAEPVNSWTSAAMSTASRSRRRRRAGSFIFLSSFTPFLRAASRAGFLEGAAVFAAAVFACLLSSSFFFLSSGENPGAYLMVRAAFFFSRSSLRYRCTASRTSSASLCVRILNRPAR